jgi:hypothetical protein
MVNRYNISFRIFTKCPLGQKERLQGSTII